MVFAAIDAAKRAEEKKKRIKLNPMGAEAQREASRKKLPKREFDTKALIESLEDEKTPMKKVRLEDSVRGKKMVFKKSGGRVNLRGGGICKKGMNKKAIGRNS